jgi:hypothetical protein
MFKLCIFVGSVCVCCYFMNSLKHYNCHLTAQYSPVQINCYISDTTMCAEYLTSYWRLTEMLHTLQCQFTAQCSPTYITLCYLNDTTTLLTCWASLWVTCDWMLQTPQWHFAAQCSPNYINLRYLNNTSTHPTCRVSLWRLTRKAKLYSHQFGCHASSLSGFLTFCLSMLIAVFLFFCRCLSVQKLDLSTWSLICAFCVRTISVCLLRLNFPGNEWA